MYKEINTTDIALLEIQAKKKKEVKIKKMKK